MAKAKRMVMYKPYPPTMPIEPKYTKVKVLGSVEKYSDTLRLDEIPEGTEYLDFDVSCDDYGSNSLTVQFCCTVDMNEKEIKAAKGYHDKNMKRYELLTRKYEETLVEWKKYEKESESNHKKAAAEAERKLYEKLKEKYG